ncbi:hypothetical protein SAMN05216382_2660 [Sphingomonas palmae]|uniref:Uncharacterized protein n=1 Tax=Sphingomonas palmae TaxID=1855283 RepID=A0A1H7T3T4_9SPHN|nr:hypothetical protein SAMN05216382_2660 [Sphingomonas palmae]
MNAISPLNLLMSDHEELAPAPLGALPQFGVAWSGERLTREEMVVIAIGRRDASSFWWRGAHDGSGWRIRLLSFLHAMTGQRGVQSLASERLETLRLLVCTVVRRRPSEVKELSDRLASLGMHPSAVAEAIHLAERS